MVFVRLILQHQTEDGAYYSSGVSSPFARVAPLINIDKTVRNAFFVHFF